MITYVGAQIIHYSRGDERRMILLVMVTMAVFSGFINNTAVVAMFLPIMLGVAKEFEISPSKLLIPLSFASILGGTTSLIGTSTNILVHGLMQENGLEGIGMFEITPVGLIYAAVGLTYLFFIGRHLLPDRGTVTSYLGDTGSPRASVEYMTEVQVPAGSQLIGQMVKESIRKTHPTVRLLQILRDEAVYWPPLDDVEIAEGDIFLLKGDANEIMALYKQEGLELIPGLIADTVVNAIGAHGPHVVLSGVYLLTVLFTELMSNNAAAVLMVPIALSVANGLGVDPRPFAIAVAFAGSAAFSTPIGYQTNTLVYGPGGYRFTDFTRVGLPLNVILWIPASFLIPLFWPLVPVG